MPPLAEGMVLLRVQICGICGTDLAYWQGEGRLSYPYSAGHEMCGSIEQLGAGVKNLDVGQRVAVDPNLGCATCRYCRQGRPNLCDRLKTRPIKSNGGFSDFVRLDYRMVHPISNQLSAESAVFIEPLSCVLHAIELAKPLHHDAAVFGLGTMGILAARILQERGCRFTLIEPAPERRRLAEKSLGEYCGRTDILAPQEVEAQELSDAVDTVVECSGNINAIRMAIKMLRKTGRLVLAGLAGGASDGTIPFELITKKELVIKGSWLNPNTFKQAIEWAQRNADFLEQLESRTFALADIRRALACSLQPEVIKVMVRP